MKKSLNINKNPFDEERKKIFGKIYLANVRNRLRELENPTDIDCKRWIWELVQNAKDSISNQPNRKDVDIKIKVEKDIYSFIHNGSPFSIETLVALIYKYSEGKSNNGESTGRFGTGFLTTHSLSKTVRITGDIIQKNEENIRGFNLTMYREGEDKELSEGLDKTEKSYSLGEAKGWTTFEYVAKTLRNKEAGKLGIQNFKENIAKVMLFCPEIKSIELNDNGKIFSIIRDDIKKNLLGGCKILSLIQKDGINKNKKRFLYFDYNEHNEKLTERFDIERNLRICCAIELDLYDNIIINNKSPYLFCSFPLIGSESFELPFIINSPDFEPDSERQTILLDGNDINEETGKISDPGINKMILLKSQEMYKTLINYICENGIKSRFLLAKGLKTLPYITRFFDRNWYENNFMNSMRDILINYPIVWNGEKYKKLSEICIPMINSYHDIVEQKKVYDIISILCKNKVPIFEESKNFERSLWSNDKRIHFINLELCYKYIEALKTITLLENKINDVWKWLNDFLVLVNHLHPEYFEKYAIIPNMYSEFIIFTKDLATSKEVPDNIIECIMSLGIYWKKNHIHKNIINYSTRIEHDIEFAISIIKKNIKNDFNKILILMHYIPYDEDNEFIEKRNLIYDFCFYAFKEYMFEKKDGSKFPKELWDQIDNIIIATIMKDIEKSEKIGKKYTIDYLKKFIEFIIKYYPNYIYHYSIFPNQNEKFCSINDLYEDDNIPSEFKQILKDCFFVDIKEKLLNKQYDYLNLNINKKRIYDYNFILRENFNKNELHPFYKKEAASRLLKIIPKYNTEIKDKDDSQNKQIILFRLYIIFTKENLKYVQIERNELNEGIWKYSNEYIYEIIRDIIEKHDNIDSLSKYLNKNNDETINILKYFTKFTKKGKIFLNQNNDLCEIDNELYNEGNNNNDLIPEELKDISNILGFDIRKRLLHGKMERLCEQSFTYKELCFKIDQLMFEKYDIKNFSDKNFKNASVGLIEEYFDKIGEEKAKNFFPQTYSIKDNIILNVIYDKKARKNMADFGKSFGNEAISELLKNPNLIKSIINGEINDNNHQEYIKGNSDDKKQYIIKDGENNIKIICNSDLISNEKNHNFYQTAFNNVISYQDDFDFGNKLKEKTGFSGEAYIYELLLNSGKYKNVKWLMLSENGFGEDFEFNGKKYNIKQDDSHYDIVVETFENYKYYIEVKSTKNKFGNKVPFYLSQKQIETMKSIKSPDKYILAVVFNILIEPKHFFMILNDDMY